MDWLTFDAGLRYDSFATKDEPEVGTPEPEKRGNRTSPNIGLTLKPWDGVQFFDTYKEGYRPPSLQESLSGGGFLQANPNLDAEIARNWEFGLNLSKDDVFLAGDKFRFKAAYFDNTTDGYIARTLDRTTWMYTRTNIDRAKFSGIEISSEYDMGRFFLNGAFTYYDKVAFCMNNAPCQSSSLSDDYSANHIPPKHWTSLTFGARAFDQRLTLGTRVTIVGARAMDVIPDGTNLVLQWDPYTLTDVFANFKINDDFVLDVSAENIFDKYYVDPLGATLLPSPGRTIRMSLTAKF
ncbi:TonB-dependent receptor domain-containing protein [Aquamicrobium segne]|uniref:TonB-dependent receptor domain-containing protein n=1 Tax=Aquamicrobium segne TaxID=469547 RepID=A0ABW0GYD3_9HYPH